MAEAHLANFQEAEGVTFHEAMQRAQEIPALGPKIRSTVVELADMLTRATQMALGGGATDDRSSRSDTAGEAATASATDGPDAAASQKKPAPVADVLKLVLDSTEMIEKLRAKRDPQDDARAENLEELIAVAREFDAQQPGAGLLAFLTEVSLVAAADDLDDQSGTVSLMTLHTAKGLEYPAVFITGVEEGLIPHQMSIDELGGINEERRLMYVGITRAREKLFITLASTRATFGDIAVAMPSRFLQEIPEALIEWRQSPGEVTGRGGTQSRALNAGRAPGAQAAPRGHATVTPRSPLVRAAAVAPQRSPSLRAVTCSPHSTSGASASVSRRKPRPTGGGFPNTIVGSIRDNGDLELALGDRIRHDEYGEGRVNAVTGAGSKRVAHVTFDTVGERKLLVKLAPIEKLSE